MNLDSEKGISITIPFNTAIHIPIHQLRVVTSNTSAAHSFIAFTELPCVAHIEECCLVVRYSTPRLFSPNPFPPSQFLCFNIRLIMHTSHTDLPIPNPPHQPAQTSHPPPRMHNLRLHPHLLPDRHRPQKHHRQCPRDTCILPVPGFRYRHEGSGGQHVEDGGCGAAVQAISFVAEVGGHGEEEGCLFRGGGFEAGAVAED